MRHGVVGFFAGLGAAFAGLILGARWFDELLGWFIVCGLVLVGILIGTGVRSGAGPVRDATLGVAAGLVAGTVGFFGLIVWALSNFQ